jgi:PAS domain S-box-containing protein
VAAGRPDRHLRVLVLEDLDADAELMASALERAGAAFTVRHVKTRDEFVAALTGFAPDVILADYTLPGFGGEQALEIATARSPDVPVIVVSGSLLDDTALELIRLGAVDYVFKNNLARLPSSVRRAISEADDVRERKRALHLLAESESRFRGIVETAQEGIWMFGGASPTYMNRRMAEMVGLPPGDEGRVAVDEIVDVDSRAAFESRTFQLAAGVATTGRFDCRLRRKDGTGFWASIAMSRMQGDGESGAGFVAMVTDVTDQRRLQERLMVADRMTAVGTLAASVAHEINNPLAAMVGNLQLALADVEVADRKQDVREELQDSVDCAERIRVIVKDLKLFGRAREERSGPVNVRAVIESSLRMARNELHHRARVTWTGQDVPAVAGDEARLGQVFLNLVVNAAQAIDIGHAERNEISIDTRLSATGRVVVEIRDTGCGIAPEVLRHVFEPFFTTKGPEVGTGLGLAICRRILRGMDAHVELESEPGRGTVARVTLPVASAGAAAIRAQESPGPVAASRRARVLVVDDEAMIVKLALRALGSEHEVTGESSPREAIRRVREGERFDVILCDLMMPEVSGMAAFREIAEARPELAAAFVFMSGGAFAPEARAFLDGVPNARIEKPFDVQDLRNLVNARLRAAAGAA